jgi:hypothetical protein
MALCEKPARVVGFSWYYERMKTRNIQSGVTGCQRKTSLSTAWTYGSASWSEKSGRREFPTTLSISAWALRCTSGYNVIARMKVSRAVTVYERSLKGGPRRGALRSQWQCHQYTSLLGHPPRPTGQALSSFDQVLISYLRQPTERPFQKPNIRGGESVISTNPDGRETLTSSPFILSRVICRALSTTRRHLRARRFKLAPGNQLGIWSTAR